MTHLLSEIDEFTDQVAAIRAQRDGFLDSLREQIAHLTEQYEMLWMRLFEPEAQSAESGNGRSTEVRSGIDDAGNTILQLGRLHRETCDALVPLLGAEFLRPFRDRGESVLNQMRRHWPFRNESEIASSRAYFDAAGTGVSAKELLDELRG